jgi:outer membrane protein insertion porin family
VTEGQPYTVTAVRLEGEYLGKEAEFKQAGGHQAGRALPRRGRGRHHHAPSPTASAAFGYAFARVDARPEIDRAKGRVVLPCWRPTRSAASTCAA